VFVIFRVLNSLWREIGFYLVYIMAGKIFGIDLQTLVQQQNVEVPKLVTHILEFLLNREGLSTLPEYVYYEY